MSEIALNRCITQDVVNRLNLPVGQAEGLPPAAYYDEAVWDLERRKVFGRGWIAVCFTADIANPGDVFPVSLAGYELVVARGQDNVVRCFHNVCRHRGMKVVTDRCRRARALSCPWHAWTYDLKGELMATPHIGGVGRDEASGFARGGLGLKAVRCETWLNFVFVDVSGEARPFADRVRPVEERYRDYNFAVLRPAERTTQVRLDGNWKVVVEGGVEDYHLPWVHPALVPHPGTFKPEWVEDCYVGFVNTHPAARAFSRFQADPKSGGEIRLPLFPHIDTTQPAQGSLSLLFPNAYISVHPSHVMCSILLPESPASTIYRRAWLFVGDGAADDKYAGLREATIETWLRVGSEDEPLIRATQRMLKAREAAGVGTRFSPFWEPAVVQFQRMVVDRLTS
jgi:choline monooxygenase